MGRGPRGLAPRLKRKVRFPPDTGNGRGSGRDAPPPRPHAGDCGCGGDTAAAVRAGGGEPRGGACGSCAAVTRARGARGALCFPRVGGAGLARRPGLENGTGIPSGVIGPGEPDGSFPNTAGRKK